MQRSIFSRAALLSAACLIANTKLFAAGVAGYTNTPIVPGTTWHVHDPNRPQPRVVAPGENFSQNANPPADALVLFDGKDFSKWESDKGEVRWKIQDGYMETTKTGMIRTKDQFSDFQMHLEFATPEKVEGSGQGRGNNGVLILGRYEIQVLDSFNNSTYPDGQASAIYGQTPPLVNASRGPGQWQTYDIIFEAPRWEDGKLVKKAYVTVLHNGVVVHHRREILGTTGHQIAPVYGKPQEKGAIHLYEHGNPVRFRNIWIRNLGEYDKP